eukprot:SAG31_NODE_34506_length_332_cov_0.875536_1_plen_30_part_10
MFYVGDDGYSHPVHLGSSDENEGASISKGV